MKQKVSNLKILITAIFAVLIFGGYFYCLFGKFPADGSFKFDYLYYACVGACFLLSLIFIRFNSKKILITLALAINVVADYFLILMPTAENKQIGLCVFCGVQFFYLLYSLLLNKSIGAKVINLAFRVGLCLVAYFVLPMYFTLGTFELIAIMYILNFLVSLFIFLVHIKTEWLLFLGFLLFFVCDIFVGLTNGGIEILGITGAFVDFVKTYDIAFYIYIPGLFLIATSSVFARGKREED